MPERGLTRNADVPFGSVDSGTTWVVMPRSSDINWSACRSSAQRAQSLSESIMVRAGNRWRLLIVHFTPINTQRQLTVWPNSAVFSPGYIIGNPPMMNGWSTGTR